MEVIMKQFLVLLFVFLSVSFLHSQVTINVPGDYSTIQAAINAAKNGDLVLVADGTYLENINFMGKAITVASHFINDPDTSHITNTIIDGSNPAHPDSGTVVMFKSGEDTNSVLCGFTITGGTGTMAPSNPLLRAGGGIVLYQSGAKIMNNIIEYNIIDNIPWAYGGGIISDLASNSDIIIKDNVIQNNVCNGDDYACAGGIKISTYGYALISNNKIIGNSISASIIATGGGIKCWGPIGEIYIVSNYIKGNTVQTNYYGGGGINISECNTNPPIIENNIIVDNFSSKYGGGVLIDLNLDNLFKPGLNRHQSIPENSDFLGEQFLVNNTIYNNSATSYGGGFYAANNMTANIMNCILWGNTAPSNPQIFGTVNVSYSDIEGGWTGTGNIDEHPLFDMSSEFYHLISNSPCVDSGNPGSQYNDVEDPNNLGNPLYPAHGTLRNDMGHVGGPASLWGYWEWPVPVELTSFTATSQLGKVILNWATATEINNLGFEIERKILLNQNQGEWVRIAFLEGNGTTTEPKEYSYVDDISTIQATTLVYRLKQMDFLGTYEYSDEVFVENPSPVDYVLYQNYPNPFNPTTTITFGIPVKTHVVLKVFNAVGEEVAQFYNGEKEAGRYTFEFNAAELPSGIYLYQLKTTEYNTIKKMILMK